MPERLMAWQGVFMTLAALLVLAALAMYFGAQYRRIVVARAEAARDGAYRELAERTATELAELRRSVTAIEKLMRDVG